MRDKAISLVKRLQGAGHEAYLVGGCVRDELLGCQPRDFDIVSSAKPEEIEKALLGLHLIRTGAAFGVLTAVVDGDQFQIATFRADEDYSDGRHPEQVRFVDTLEEDLARRDFTFNAMALDPISNRLFDYNSGQRHIRNKIVMFVGRPSQRVMEDHLRMLRAVKFACRFGFKIDSSDRQAIIEHAYLLPRISRERISAEFQEILLAQDGLQMLDEYGLLPSVVPGIEALKGLLGEQDPLYHAEGNAFVHTMMVVDQLRLFAPGYFELLLAGLLHDIGKPACQQCHSDGKITNRGHDEVGARIAENICRHWLKLSNDQTHFVTELVANHMRMHHVHEMKRSKLIKLAEHPHIQEMVWLQHADAVGRELAQPKDPYDGKMDYTPSGKVKVVKDSHLEFMTQKLAEFKLLPPQQQPNSNSIINGDHLIQMGLKPGPDFKTILNAAREAQLAGEFDENTYQSWLERHLSCEVIA